MFKVYYNGFQKKFSNQNLFLVMVFLVNHKKNKINPILQVRSYSLTTSSVFTSKSLDTIDPWFITGFTDAEGSFIVRVRKNSKYKNGWLIAPVFSITLSSKDIYILQKIKVYFRVGTIAKSGKDTFKFKVESKEQILKAIITHFYKYPLISNKRADYILWKHIIELMNDKKHLTLEGLHEIISIKASINKGLTDVLKAAFPNIKCVDRPLVAIPETLPEQWIAGFTYGEGCFKVLVNKSSSIKVGFQVVLVFQITQHSRDEILMNKLIYYFECGSIEKNSIRHSLDFKVHRFADNYEKIIPFFNQHNILGKKYKDFKDWCKVAEIVKTKNHLTIQGLDEILKIKSHMNTGR